MKQRQFKAPQEGRTFFDRKIRRQGGSRIIAFSRFIPKDWRYVRVHLTHKDKHGITLRIVKLLGSDINAHTNKTHKKRKQNT